MSTMESLDGMQSRHRKEAKELQSRITQKKKQASKKTRKGVNDECETLEHDLKQRQAQELATLDRNPTPDIDDVPELDTDHTAGGTTEPKSAGSDTTEQLAETKLTEPTNSEDGQPKKRNRAKERLARRAAETAAAVEEAKMEAANQPSAKDIEHKKLKAQFDAHGLQEKLIRPDGHCLFSAVADQLSQVGIPLDPESNVHVKENERYRVVRNAAARYMDGHPDEFAGFLDEPLHSHTGKIRDTAEWGGHLELSALAKAYKVEICVIQDGAPETIGPDKEADEETPKIWLGYYRHGFGLGEHYNSLRKAP